ncbi:MAG: glycosyltransferase family 4 protein [Bacteroidia bacterium]|nr:glycosyltransferase family 4 protein [Bacteroidia bacterium]
MRLLYLQQLLVLPGCPGNARSWEFARQWQAAGHEITLLASTAHLPPDHPLIQGQPFPLYTTYEGVRLILLKVSYDHMMPFAARIKAFLQFYRQVWALRHHLGGYDAVLAYSAPLSVGDLGRRLAWHLQVPFLFEIADVWPDVPAGMGLIPQGPILNWLYRRTRRMYEAARRIYVFSEGMRDQVMEHGVAGERIRVIPNGTQIRPLPQRPVRQEPGLRVLYAGTVGRANDLTLLLAAIRLLVQAGRTDIHLTLLGGGNDLSRVRAYAQAQGPLPVTFLAQVPQEAVREQLHAADVGVVCFAAYPVLAANSATKFFEYLAAGLPVVINYEGWQADYLRTWNCGLAAPAGDAVALASHLQYLADHPQLRDEMGQRGRALAVACFDRVTLASQMMEDIQASLT